MDSATADGRNLAATGTRPEARPLVVDLDGTLLRSDLLVESIFALIGHNPLVIFPILRATFAGKVALKTFVASRADIDCFTLPYRNTVLELIEDARCQGRPVILATAAHSSFAQAIADHVGLFDQVFSTSGCNLSGKNKADLLCKEFGKNGFDYIGNSRDDLPVWDVAASRLGVGGSLLTKFASRAHDVHWIESGPSILDKAKHFARMIRVHQWAKNLLVFVPLITSHHFDVMSLASCAIAFLCFCAAASSFYIVNDLLDINADRLHARKKSRPFAAGDVGIGTGLVTSLGLLVFALTLSLVLSPWLFASIGAYLVLTASYSFYLKRKLLLDVIALALLYGIRIFGGAAALGVVVSHWLLGFSFFVFTFLATIKRYAELVTAIDNGRNALVKRNYRSSDAVVVCALAASFAMNSIMLLALYISSEEVARAYQNPWALWGACPLFVYLFGRMLFLTQRREMHDDPIVFVAKDGVSRLAVAVIVLIVLCASASIQSPWR